jgi:hypothetical protein
MVVNSSPTIAVDVDTFGHSPTDFHVFNRESGSLPWKWGDQ